MTSQFPGAAGQTQVRGQGVAYMTKAQTAVQKTVKNGIKVDSDVYAKDYHVLVDYSNPKLTMEYSVYLNYTDLANNNNKFYIIQLLENDYKKG